MSLVEFPIDILKIDKYFIDRLDQYNIRRLVKTIIEYTHRVRLKVIAEGVETEKQLKILKKIKCDLVQGYYYTNPCARILRNFTMNLISSDTKNLKKSEII